MIHQRCNINLLQERRILHLNLFMYKQRHNVNIVNTRNVRTRAHDALIFKTERPQNVKYERNILYKDALSWNSLPDVTLKHMKNSKKVRRKNCKPVFLLLTTFFAVNLLSGLS